MLCLQLLDRLLSHYYFIFLCCKGAEQEFSYNVILSFSLLIFASLPKTIIVVVDKVCVKYKILINSELK